MRHLADVIFALLMFGAASIAVLRPVIILRWAKRAYPDLPEEDETILWIARVVGLGGLGVVGFFLLIIIRSFSI